MIGNVIRRLAVAPIYYSGRFGRRNPRIWVFGNSWGYRDNPRYLAERIAVAHGDLQACWIARTEEEAEAAGAAGLTVAMRGSADARSLQRRAGAAFLCIGINDLAIAHLGGSRVVMLYHGTPIKRVLLDAELHRLSGATVYARAAQRLYRWSLRSVFSRVDMFVAAGELARDRYVTAFGCPPSSVRVLGTPRFDVIQGEGVPGERSSALRRRLGIEPHEYLVLWLPTWRERGDASWLPRLDARVLEAALRGASLKVVVKPHPNSDHAVFGERVGAAPEFQLLPDGEIDVNQLLREADALITDYSSSVFDFAILERPILFFAPDVDDYDERGRGLYEPYGSLTAGHFHRSWESLLPAVAEAANVDASEGMTVTRHLRALARNCEAPGSSERIIQAVRGSLGIS
jgi:CDP-glycerol glycerophosphotransferase (TagB/SpsB family)